MFCAPEARVTVMAALGRSRMTVSFVYGRRGVGSVCVPTGVNWLGPGTGATGVCPLFQFNRVVHCPSLSFIQIAGTRASLTNSIPPCATSLSRAPLFALSPVLVPYCQKPEQESFGLPVR